MRKRIKIKKNLTIRMKPTMTSTWNVYEHPYLASANSQYSMNHSYYFGNSQFYTNKETTPL